MKLILNDGTEYEAITGTFPGNITISLETYGDIQELENSLTKKGNLDKVTFGDGASENIVFLKDIGFSALKKENRVEVTFMSRKKTDQEIYLDSKNNSIETAVTYLTDEQALTVKDLCKKWEDDPEGYSYSLSNPEDLRRQFSDGLWKLQKDHEKQSSWYPGADPTLWVQIIDGHSGDLEDPIQVPDGVTTSGFEYVYGKYYLYEDVIYLCQRQGLSDPEENYGETIKLYFYPSSLIGTYFIKIE